MYDHHLTQRSQRPTGPGEEPRHGGGLHAASDRASPFLDRGHVTILVPFRPPVVAAALLLLAAIPAIAQETRPADPPPPRLVTAETRADPEALAALETPGDVFFKDGFEDARSLKLYFEIRGRDDGRAVIESSSERAHTGTGCMRFTAPANDGRPSGAGASAWFGPRGREKVHFRRYVRFAGDYDQGNLHHVGGGLAAVAGTGRWDGMGKAGVRPRGDDRFTASFEPWRGWGRYEPPGYMFVYAYWMDMERDRDGNWWGNMLGPEEDGRIVPPRGRWTCLEHMVKANTPGRADGELAAWIDGRLYLHYEGIRWRSSEAVRLKRFDVGIYVHHARRANTVWYDDVALSTGYVGPLGEADGRGKDRGRGGR